MTADDVQLLNTRVGAAPAAAAATPGAAVDVMQSAATLQAPAAPALEPLQPMSMAALCFANSTRSAINDIACRAAEAAGRTVYRIVAATLPSGRTRGDMPPAYRERLLQLPDKNTDFRPLVQDWYEEAPAVVTANICLPLGVGNGTTVRVVRILFPDTATFTPIEVPMAGGRITVQLASCMPKCIVLQVRDGQGPSPHFPGLTDGQFPYMLPQIQALSVTLPNRRFTIMSDAFALSLGAAMTGKKQHLPLPHFHLLLLQQPLHLTTCPH